MIQLRKLLTAIVASVLLFVGVFVGSSSALAGNYSADSWDKLPTLSDNKPAVSGRVSDSKPVVGDNQSGLGKGGYYSRRDRLATDKAFSQENRTSLSDTLSGGKSTATESKSYIDLDEKDNINTRNAKKNLEKTAAKTERGIRNTGKNLEQTADDTESGLEEVVDNVREKLNLDQPLYPGTKEFIGDVKETVEDSVDAVQDTFTGGADNLTSGQRSYKNR